MGYQVFLDEKVDEVLADWRVPLVPRVKEECLVILDMKDYPVKVEKLVVLVHED